MTPPTWKAIWFDFRYGTTSDDASKLGAALWGDLDRWKVPVWVAIDPRSAQWPLRLVVYGRIPASQLRRWSNRVRKAVRSRDGWTLLREPE